MDQRFLSALDSQSLSQARALPASAYVGLDSLQLDLAQVLGRGWQLLAGLGQLAAAGGQIETTLGLVPVWVIADDSNVRVLHNVCRHRAGPLDVIGSGPRRKLRCRYHGWSYGVDGCLLKAVEMDCAEAFDPATIALPQAQVAVWRGLVFAALEPTRPFADLVEGIDERIESVGIQQFSYHSHISYNIDCNWKVYLDNFLEGYHIPHIHPELNRMLDYREYELALGQWWSLQYSTLDSDDALYGTGEALYYFLYPNTMLNILPDRMQTNRVIPLGPDRCQVVFDYYYRPDEAHCIAEKAKQDHDFSDLVQQQDVDICVAVQRGLSSGSYKAGRLNPKRESGVWHFQERLRADYRDAHAE